MSDQQWLTSRHWRQTFDSPAGKQIARLLRQFSKWPFPVSPPRFGLEEEIFQILNGLGPDFTSVGKVVTLSVTHPESSQPQCPTILEPPYAQNVKRLVETTLADDLGTIFEVYLEVMLGKERWDKLDGMPDSILCPERMNIGMSQNLGPEFTKELGTELMSNLGYLLWITIGLLLLNRSEEINKLRPLLRLISDGYPIVGTLCEPERGNAFFVLCA